MFEYFHFLIFEYRSKAWLHCHSCTCIPEWFLMLYDLFVSYASWLALWLVSGPMTADVSLITSLTDIKQGPHITVHVVTTCTGLSGPMAANVDPAMSCALDFLLGFTCIINCLNTCSSVWFEHLFKCVVLCDFHCGILFVCFLFLCFFFAPPEWSQVRLEGRISQRRTFGYSCSMGGTMLLRWQLGFQWSSGTAFVLTFWLLVAAFVALIPVGINMTKMATLSHRICICRGRIRHTGNSYFWKWAVLIETAKDELFLCLADLELLFFFLLFANLCAQYRLSLACASLCWSMVTDIVNDSKVYFVRRHARKWKQ